MNVTPSSILKKPKIERNDDDCIETTSSHKQNGKQDEQEELDSKEEQKVALIALIEHRSREVQHLKQRIAYYSTQLAEAERRLEDSQSKLARLSGRSNAAPSKPFVDNGFKDLKAERKSPSPLPVNEGSSVDTQSKLAQLNGGSNAVPSKPSVDSGIKNVKVERKSPSPVRVNEGSSRSQPQSRTELVIPPVNPKVPQPVKSAGSSVRASSGSSSQPGSFVPSDSGTKVKVEKPPSNRSSNDVEVVEIQDRGTKRKIEQKEHKELIPLICSRSSPCTVHCHTSNHISSQHKRKLRSVAICPANPQLFVTSALDGMVNLWQLQSRGSGASLLSTTDCLSPKQRRWPEDIAWHPMGNSLFSIYTADSGDSQISVLNLNKTQGRDRVTFLEDKPHVKGIINSIVFMPWENSCFATGGSDHAVILWNDKDDENIWKPKALHRNMHSSAVMGVAGMQHKQMVLSAGADKRIVGFDVQVARADFKHQLDSKCMSVLPNPCDFNLFMVQTGTHGKQLRLFDVRLRQTEIHSFGFKQESSDSQSALINQAWSPDGLYLTSGSVDPVIHIFDIRYTSHKPSQSIRAHQKRVFKAVWHYSQPLLISISSDLHIGLHKIT